MEVEIHSLSALLVYRHRDRDLNARTPSYRRPFLMAFFPVNYLAIRHGLVTPQARSATGRYASSSFTQRGDSVVIHADR